MQQVVVALNPISSCICPPEPQHQTSLSLRCTDLVWTIPQLQHLIHRTPRHLLPFGEILTMEKSPVNRFPPAPIGMPMAWCWSEMSCISLTASAMHPHVTYDLTDSGACGTTPGAATSNDPTPDLGDGAPDGASIYMALRGPLPLTVSHAAAGSCPGLGILRRNPTNQEWTLAAVLPTVVMNYPNTINLSDPHAVIVRRNVPGPLPLLGAWATYGFTRRLRRRIQQSRS
jgi:hypothetical protein